MKTLFWLGLVVMMLGGSSLFVPIPRNEREGFSAGGIAIGIETQRSETVSPLVSGLIILAGAGMMIAGKKKS
jgi:hypothetical protein